MPVFPLILAILIGLMAAPATAADRSRACLSKAEQRAALASHRAISLARAVRAVPKRRKGELLRARLCRRGNSLVYELTMLSRRGKVTVVAVDAANGELIKSR
jgi:uncharacterized membrane protein YkoI